MINETRENKNKELENDLRKEEKNEIRKKRLKKIFKIILLIIIIILSFMFYMHYVGTKGLVVREYKVESDNLPEELHGLKVIQFSDLKYLSTVHEKEVKKLVNKINEIRPDVVIFNGDLFAENDNITDNDVKFLTKELNRINASIGLYAIKGDMDYKNKYYSKVMDNTKFKIINNTYELVYYKSNTPILLTGCGSILNNDCDLGQTFSFNEIDNLFTISIIHEADIASTISSRYKPSLILAGHNLNGQVRLPLIGGLIKSNEGKNYLNSKYELGGSTLYVSGGIGTSDSGYRLFNHPSINFYRLVRKTK